MILDRDRATGHLTGRASRLYGRLIDRRLAALGVSSGQLPVFFALGDGGAMSQKALVERAAIEQSTMAATLARMVRDGLVAREPDPRDGRAALFRLTPEALAKLPEMAAAGAAVNAQAMQGLTPEEAEAHRATLRTIIANLERALAE